MGGPRVIPLANEKTPSLDGTRCDPRVTFNSDRRSGVRVGVSVSSRESVTVGVIFGSPDPVFLGTPTRKVSPDPERIRKWAKEV